MRPLIGKFLLYVGLIVGYFFSIAAAYAADASDKRVVIVSPFPYSEEGVPQAVKAETDIDIDLPQAVVDHFKKINAFKSVAIADGGTELSKEADWFVHGEILYVDGGNSAARYFPGGDGRASILIGIKVFDAQGDLLHEGRVSQRGTKGTNIATVWSNKRNIVSTIKVLPAKILPVVMGGDLTTPEGIVRALESGNAFAIREAAMSSRTYELFKNASVTDAMIKLVLQTVDGNTQGKGHVDAMAWCLINIGDSGDKRYIDPLIKVTESKSHNKIKGHAKDALNKISKVK